MGLRNDPYEEEYELLNATDTTGNSKDYADGDTRSLTSVHLGTESYQSTSRLIVYVFFLITALLLIFTCATFGSSIASNRKAIFGIKEIMPSVNVTTGDCETLKYVNLTLHLLINCIGTVIIGCSNYLQQSRSLDSGGLMLVCTSPTFKDIQKEMKHYNDVPFGTNSPTALLRRGKKAIILIWTILVVTSLPVHLFLNGVTGYSIQAFPVSGRVLSAQHGEPQLSATELSWQSLLVTDCANYLANAENWVTEFRNMTIVVREDSEIQKYEAFINSLNSETAETDGPPSPNEIDSCYMEPITPTCSVTVRWFPLVVTTIAMIIKSVTSFLAIRKSDHFKYRLYNALGDFIAVATRHREELSVPGECLANKGEWERQGMTALKGVTGGIPIRASHERKMWIRYLGALDWLVWIFWVASVGMIWYFVGKSLNTVRNGFRDENGHEITNIFTLFGIAGFGKVSLVFIISDEAAGLPLQVALANCPQLWLSVGYLLWNNQLTRIWGEHEWRSYAGRRKLPRVSYGAKVPGIRNTRWLQLPYVMSAMLMIVSTTMHWIVSQTMFVVEVENLSGLPKQDNAPAPKAIIFDICYSPTAIFVI